jgi:hypothetical protein
MLKTLTHSKAVDNSTNEHLWKLEGRNLEYSSHGVRSQADNDCFLSAQLVPKSKGKDRSKECTKLRPRSMYEHQTSFIDNILRSNSM